MKNFKKLVEKNNTLQKLFSKLTDTQKRLDMQAGKLKVVGTLLTTDKKVLMECREKLNNSLQNADAKELKNLSTQLQDLEKEIASQWQIKSLIEKTIADLTQTKSELKTSLRQLLKIMVEHQKTELESEKGAGILTEFLILNTDFKNVVDSLFKEHELKPLRLEDTLLSISGNFEFIEHLRLTGNDIQHHFYRSTGSATTQHYKKELNRLSRAIEIFGVSSRPV